MAVKKKTLSRNATSKYHVVRRVTDADVQIGERLRQARLKAGLSQDTLAKAVGVSFQQIQKYEKGKNRMGVGRMMEFSKVLQLDPSYFTGSVDVKRSNVVVAFDAFMATREGVQIIEHMMKLPPRQRQTVIDLAKSLALAS